MSISLRTLLRTDLDVVFGWESDLTAARMAAFTRADPTDRAAFDAHYEMVLENTENLALAIEDDGEFVGTIASFTIEGDREITYWVDRSRWGRGIASAAVGELLKVERTRPLFARAAAENAGSNAVLMRNGFVKVGDATGWADGVGAEIEENIYRLDAG